MARSFLVRKISLAVALIRWKTFMTRPAPATPSPAAWLAISPAGEMASLILANCAGQSSYGSVLASFNVEAFSLERLRSLTNEEIDERYQMFRLMSQFEVIP